MKILLVTMQYQYGQPERGVDDIAVSGFLGGLQRLGHEVEAFFYDEYLDDHGRLRQALVERVNGFQPELTFFLTYTDQFDRETLEGLRGKTHTVGWFGDDSWRFDGYSRHYASAYDWCVTTDPFALGRYADAGQSQVILSQWAAIDCYPLPEADDYVYPVSFVGGVSDYRRWLIGRLQDAGIEVACFGHGWENGILSPGGMIRVFSQSRINLNLPNSTSFDIRYLDSTVFPLQKRLERHANLLFRREYQLEKMQRSKVVGGLKARLYEIPYYGGFLLTDYAPGLEMFLAVGQEIACYQGIDDLPEMIRYYLDNDDLRERIRRRGFKRANPAYGYSERLRSILEQIG